MTFPVFSIPSDHMVITDHRDMDHIVTRGGEVRRAGKGSNDNWEVLGEHPASNPQLNPAQPAAQSQPSNPVRDNLASYNMGGWPQAVSYDVTYDLVTHIPPAFRSPEHLTTTDQT